MRSPALGWLSNYNEHTVAKQNGGGAEWVELYITLTMGMGEPTYGLLLSHSDGMSFENVVPPERLAKRFAMRRGYVLQHELLHL